MFVEREFCHAAAVVSVSGRLHCCYGGCQPDPDEHRRERDQRLGSGQEDGGLEPCQCNALTRTIPPSSGLFTHRNGRWIILPCLLLMQVLGNVGEFLALKLVSGQYAYSMEAICPTGNLLPLVARRNNNLFI